MVDTQLSASMCENVFENVQTWPFIILLETQKKDKDGMHAKIICV